MAKVEQNMQTSQLLVNANTETQVKDKPLKKIPRVIFITLLSLLIFVGYIFGFMGSGYPKINNNYYIAVFDSQSFEEVTFGDLCVVKSVDSLFSVNVGDVVLYTVNGTTYSAKVSSVDTEVLTVKNGKGEVYVSLENLEGVLIKSVPVIGFIIGFICSYYGGVFFSLVLFAYLACLTIKRIGYENTEKGRQLRERYIQEKRNDRRTKSQKDKLQKKETDLLLDLLSIDAITSYNNIRKLTNNKKCFETYEIIVNEAHKQFINSKKISKDEKIKITLLVELCVCFGRIDLDIEYKIVDLLLKTKLVNFNKVQFLENSKKLVSKGTEESLFNFTSILYVLIMKNPSVKGKEIKQIIALLNKEFNNRKYSPNDRCRLTLAKIKEIV